MAAKQKGWVHRAANGLAILFGRAMALLPWRVTRAVGRCLGLAAYGLAPPLRWRGLAHLDLAYGDSLSPQEKRAILRESLANMGIVAAEFTHIPKLTPETIDNYVDFEGFDHVDWSRGVVLIGGHLGNWEWMAPALATQQLRVTEVVRPLDDPAFNAFVDGIRRSGGIETLPKDKAGAAMRGIVRDGNILGLLVDQAPRENAVPITFFGQPAWATIGAAALAMRTGAPIHLGALLRKQDGRYRYLWQPALELVDTGHFRRDLLENSQRCQDALEAVVRAYPGQWLWLHRRWKKRPRLEAEWAQRVAKDSEAPS